MSNSFYNVSGNPFSGAGGLSSIVRAEFVAIAAGFALLPTISGNASKAVIINSGATALTVTAGTLTLGGNFSTAGAFTTVGAFNTTLVQNASVTIGLPAVSGTLATLAGAETLTNKIITGPIFINAALGTPASGVLTNATGTAAGLTAGHATVAVSLSGGSVSATTIAASGATLLLDTLTVAADINTTNAVHILAATAPASGYGDFKIYVDVADGKLKAKSGDTGVVTILASP